MPPTKTTKTTDKDRLAQLERDLEVVKKDLATAAFHLISTHGARPAILGVVERHDKDRIEPKPDSPTGRRVV